MAYTTSTEIQADFKNIDFTATGAAITTASVTQFIVEADALINSYVGSRYTVPITVESGLSLMKLLSRSLVAARIRGMLEVKQSQSTGANQNVRSESLSVSDVMKILKDIRDDNLTVVGATPLVSSSGFYSNNSTNDVAPKIEKDKTQW